MNKIFFFIAALLLCLSLIHIYQTVDRRKSTSSVTSVKMEDLNIPGVSSIDQMLQGQIPDLIFMSNSGEVGVVPKLRIRGTSTLIGNREPLWVLDGICLLYTSRCV